MKDSFKILSWRTTKMVETKPLSNFKKWICRIFDIPLPISRYFIEAMVEVDEPEKIHGGDGILIPEGNGVWLVLETKYSPFFVILSMDAIVFKPNYIGEAVTIFSAVMEGTRMPR
jgi:hypothetical protein